MRQVRHLLCLAALLIPFAARAQIGIVDHNWSLKTGSNRYGIVQITYPGPKTYTYFFFGKAVYSVQAPASRVAMAILVPLALTTGIFLFVRFKSPKQSPTSEADI